jgi:hypothetical protein
MSQGVQWVCGKDFKELTIAPGTIRNNLSALHKMKLIQYSHKSKNAYYTLPKDSLQNTMTLNQLWVTKPQLVALINRLVYDTLPLIT